MELWWAGTFVIHGGLHVVTGRMNMTLLFAMQSIFTLFVIVNEFRHPSYHGALALYLQRQASREVDEDELSRLNVRRHESVSSSSDENLREAGPL